MGINVTQSYLPKHKLFALHNCSRLLKCNFDIPLSTIISAAAAVLRLAHTAISYLFTRFRDSLFAFFSLRSSQLIICTA